jgi:hypothetical protein
MSAGEARTRSTLELAEAAQGCAVMASVHRNFVVSNIYRKGPA